MSRNPDASSGATNDADPGAASVADADPADAPMTDGGTTGIEDAPPSGRAALLEALDVRQHARRALVLGLAAGVGVPFLFVVVLAGGSPTQPLPYYAGLAFVVFVTVSMLSVGVLTGRRVLSMAVPPASVVRRAASGGLLAGLLWLAAAVALFAGATFRWVATLLAPAALLSVLGIWAVHTRYKRTTGLRPVGAVAAWVALVGALVVADLVAFDMARLLPDVGVGVDASRERLFRAGAGLLVGGQTVQAVVALTGSDSVWLPFVLAFLPLSGLAGYLLVGPGRVGLALLALGVGLFWTTVCWWLRAVPDEDVPSADAAQADPGPDRPDA